MSERSWGDILTLAALDKYSDFAVDFPNHLEKFEEIFDSTDPHRFVVLLYFAEKPDRKSPTGKSEL